MKIKPKDLVLLIIGLVLSHCFLLLFHLYDGFEYVGISFSITPFFRYRSNGFHNYPLNTSSIGYIIYLIVLIPKYRNAKKNRPAFTDLIFVSLISCIVYQLYAVFQEIQGENFKQEVRLGLLFFFLIIALLSRIEPETNESKSSIKRI
jgi:hypothetical protein